MKKLLLLLLCPLFFHLSSFGQEKTKIILDADTGNEVDDLYAIVRALIEPSWEILSLNAAHWQTAHWAVDNTMENSHRLNQMLVSYLKKEGEVKTLRGGLARMYDWGDQAQHSAAAYEIIEHAKAYPESSKLPVVVLGALTNVASAVYIEPQITSKIVVYWLGTSYDFEKDILRKTDFNAVMDIQAVSMMLNSDVEMHIIPVNVASALDFSYQETAQQLAGKHPLGDLLVQRWYDHLDGGRYGRTIWDLALIEAMIHPDMAEKAKIRTSPENGDREIWYYKSIDADRMKAEFFAETLKYLEAIE